MNKLILKPNAKINLGLNIVEKRPDGYHNLETVFYPIPLYDQIVIEPQDYPLDYTFRTEGTPLDCMPNDNLIVRALKLLKDEGYTFPSTRITLTKNIPSGAGMGGGSADAGFMLKGLNELYDLGISIEQLEQYAARLGADCAVFIQNQPVYAEGIGNVFTPIQLSLQGYYLVVVKPDIFISTARAFSYIRPRKPIRNLLQIIQQPIETWATTMYNDFEASVFPQFPRLIGIRQKLYQAGALYAAMSGSGSSLFGIFRQPVQLEHEFADCFYAGFQL